MTRHPEVESLPSALAWLARAWDSLPQPPIRLHNAAIEDGSQLGAHEFSPQMWRILAGRPTDTESVDETVTCSHLRSPHDVMACPDCHGDGVYQKASLRYRSPMSAAMHRLSKMPSPSDGTPAPVEYVLALAAHRWDVERAAVALGLTPVSEDHAKTIEAMFLLAVRRLHSRFSVAPVARSSWVDLSESQRNAEAA